MLELTLRIRHDVSDLILIMLSHTYALYCTLV